MKPQAQFFTTKEIWESSVATFLAKLVFALTFIIPVLLFPLSVAIIASVVWGLSLIALFSFYMAKQQNTSPYKVIAEHLLVAILVIIATHYIGNWVSTFS